MSSKYQSELLEIVLDHAYHAGDTFHRWKRKVDYQGHVLTPDELYRCLSSVSWYEPLHEEELQKMRRRVDFLLKEMNP